MIDVSISTAESGAKKVRLGKQGENGVRKIIFDLQSMVNRYGDGLATLVFQRNGDTAPYVVTATREENSLVWIVSSTDTAKAGPGRAEIRWFVDGALAKTVIFATETIASIVEDTEMPDVMQTWYDQMVDYVDAQPQIVIGEVQRMIDRKADAATVDNVYAKKTDIPTKLSKLTNDAGFITEIPEEYVTDTELEDVRSSLSAMIGSPLVAASAAEMTDTDRVYVYTGAETGYENGDWYYYDSGIGQWRSGGVYNSTAVATDKTLSVENSAADAKATGDAIDSLNEDITNISDTLDRVTETLEYQERTSESKNLNVTPYQSTTVSGLTITVNDDNSLSLSGDPTAGVWYTDRALASNRWLLPAGTYTLSGALNTWISLNLALYETENASTVSVEYNCGSYDGRPTTFTTDQDYYAVVRLYVNGNNGDLTGTIVYPQIEAGTEKTDYVSPWPEIIPGGTRFDTIEDETSKIPGIEDDVSELTDTLAEIGDRVAELEKTGTRKYSRTGNIIQYIPTDGAATLAQIDFESETGFNEITFTHCGENLIDMTVNVHPSTGDGITATYEDGYIHVSGTNTNTGWNRRAIGYLSTYNYFLPRGIYSFGNGIGCSIYNLDGSSAGNVGGTFSRDEGWQAVQWYASVRGGHTVDWYWPLMLVYGDDVPEVYKPFEGERVTVTLPKTVYGGYIDITNSVLHVTKELSNGELVSITEETYDLDSIALSEIKGINTLYSVDGNVSASGVSPVLPTKDYEEPVADCYINGYYLEDKISRIKTLAESCIGNGDMFFFITDMHAENNRLLSIPLIREIGRKCKIPRVFVGGDMSDGMGTPAKKIIKLFSKEYAGEVHYTMGNHEYMSTSENVAAYYWSQGKSDQVGSMKGGYYYVDNPQQKVRYVVLNGYKENSTQTNWVVGYDTDQLSWLENVALNVESGWGIFVFMHDTWMISWETGQSSDYEGRANLVFDVLDGYSGNGEIFAVLGGHMHLDAVKHTDGGIPVILTTCDKCQPYVGVSTGKADFDASIRKIKEISEQAFDVVVLDRDNRELHFIRIGCPVWNLVDDVIDSTNEYIEERIVALKAQN